jgi:protein disulfide-isomerase|uniref:thioredoxin family protein n=1 Tax=Prosthecobacter sp. TaxID=1965333 RepID=UPI00378340F6
MKTFILSVFALFTVTSASLAKTGWDDDYEKSLTKAKEDQKMVLLDFTGSDWCGYCIKLDEEVFSKPSFKKFAKENLVLVELDYPRGKNLPKKTKEQNDSLKSKYGISGYPTIILLDSDGKEAARWIGYKATLLDELKDKVKTPGKESAK